MDKGIRKIRAGIKRRKRERTIQDIDHHQKTNTIPIMISEEEKHGFQLPMYDNVDDFSVKKGQTKPTAKRNSSFRHATLSLLLFIACAVLFKTSIIPFQGAKDIAHHALTEEFPFAKVHHWYVETLGVPLAFTPQLPVNQAEATNTSSFPIHGEVMETFATNGTGIMISPTEATKVTSWAQGMVVFAGKDKKTNQTVIIQHPDGSKTTYGLLSTVDVHLYKFVQANEVIGTFEPSQEGDVAYFAMEKDKQFIDPAEVIRVDDVR